MPLSQVICVIHYTGFPFGRASFTELLCCLIGFAPVYLQELCKPVSRAVRRRHCVGGGAPVNFGRRRRRGARRQKKAAGGGAAGGWAAKNSFFLRFTKKCRSILKIFLGTFLVNKALRFADDQC